MLLICYCFSAGTAPPVTAYDKNGLKILIHMAKNVPREDVSVMVVSVMSTNTSVVKGFVFQAAVPKVRFCYSILLLG